MLEEYQIGDVKGRRACREPDSKGLSMKPEKSQNRAPEREMIYKR